MTTVRSLNLILAFILEVAMLLAFGAFAYKSVDQGYLRWFSAILLPALAAVLWGFFLAPKAKHRLSRVPGILLSHFLFFLAALALNSVGQGTWAALFALAALLHGGLALRWKQW